MERPPDRPRPDAASGDRGQRPDLSETRRRLSDLARRDRPRGGESLPPWSTLGLGSEPDPSFDRDWNPLAASLDDANVPDRPSSRAKPPPAAIAVAVALIFIAGAIALIRFDVVGGDDDPPATETGFSAPSSDDPTAAANLNAAAGSPSTGAASPVSTAEAAVITTETADTSGGTTTPSETPVATEEAATAPVAAATNTAAEPLLIAAASVDVDGIQAGDLASAIQGALGDTGGQAVEIVGPDRIGEAAIVIDAAPPDQGFTVQEVVVEPWAVVTSPRLPLFGAGGEQVRQLLAGDIADWRAVGAEISLAVEPLELDGYAAEGTNPVETYSDYEALVAGLDDHRGGIALVPVALVDFRVNILAVDGIDPLRDGNLTAYPYGRRLYVGVRSDQAATLDPVVASALGALGLPRAAPAAAVTTVGFVGDIVPGRNVHIEMEERDDFTYPFLEVAAELSSYDLTFANLEGDLSDSIPQPDDDHTFSFVSDPRMIDGMKLAGIDAVTLANNHAMNFGVEGLVETMEALRTAEMPYVGAGENLDEARQAQFFDVNGITVAILGINGITANPDTSLPGVVSDGEAATADSPGTNPFVSDQFLADIEAAAQQADVVIPYFHMGIEYKEMPPEWAIAAAHAAIDAGAAMVVANHPHLIQGMEIYNGKPIVYSLGNFIFDQMYSVEVRQGMILEIAFRGDQIAALRFHGVEIENFSQPRIMSGPEQAALMDRFWRLTDAIARAT